MGRQPEIKEAETFQTMKSSGVVAGSNVCLKL